jgi:tetratricopeptide (TPR) repeat protein
MKDHKLAAIVFTDIVGYTRRMEKDEEGTMNLLTRQRAIIFPKVKEFGGEVIKEIGDGLLIMFNSANRAVRFTIAVQEALKGEELTIRAGIHIGDVIFEDGDVFGSAVNIAARIEPLAPAGGICISEDVRNQIRNQSDILLNSIGKKELKGVDTPKEIFQIVTEGFSPSKTNLPFYKDLWQRRVIQVTVLYLVLSLLVRSMMNFIVQEYMLSPHLPDLVWYILLSLLPSIILVSYFHGRKGFSKWTKVEMIGLPINIIVAGLILGLVFKGKDLGAMTTKLTIQNEDGERIEKLVIKNEYRKKIFIFNMKNASGDSGLDYLQYGIPDMLQYDLSQDILLFPETVMSSIYLKMAEAGYEDAIGLPVTLMKQYASKRHMNFFVVGQLNITDNQYTLEVKLYETRLTRLVADISVKDASPFNLVDQLSVEIKRAMGLPESHISETIDLPVSEIFTDSDQALLYYSQSILEEARNNWTENVHLLEQAIQEDNDFALAYVKSTLSYFNISQVEKARQAMQSARDLLYKLPERQQFILKYVYYVIDQQPEKALNVVKMWVELYPDDIVAHSILAQRYSVRAMYQEAIQEYKEIVHLDPEQFYYLSVLGDFYLQLGNFDSALVYYNKYAHHLPEQADSYQNLGDFYSLTGDLDLAKENYEKALLLADGSEKIPVKIKLAEIDINTGNFDLAYAHYQEALEISHSPKDSSRVFEALQKYFLTKGQAHKSLEVCQQKLEKYKSFLSPKDYVARQVFNVLPYMYAGEKEKAIELLETLSKQLEPPLDNLIPFGFLLLYAESGEVEKAEQAMQGAQALIDGWGEEVMMVHIYLARAKINESLSQYEEAIENYNLYLQMYPTGYEIYGAISRCYREMKDFKKAEEAIKISLEHMPYNPVINYEAAMLHLDMKDNEKGREYLERAVEIWQHADETYEKARIAKEKWNTLRGVL